MGTKGEIKLPPGAIQVGSQGGIDVDGKPVATLKVMDFPVDHMPQKHFDGLFASDSAQPAKNPQVQGGQIEESNVSSIGEMVKMIQGMRNYESSQKLIQTLDHMAEIAIQGVGRVS